MINPLNDILEDLRHCHDNELRTMLLTVAELLDEYRSGNNYGAANSVRMSIRCLDDLPAWYDKYIPRDLGHIRTWLLNWKLEI